MALKQTGSLDKSNISDGKKIEDESQDLVSFVLFVDFLRLNRVSN